MGQTVSGINVRQFSPKFWTDENDIWRKVTKQLGRTPEDVVTETRKVADQHALRKHDSIWTNIALSHTFENIALVVIILNALWIGIEVDQNHSEDRRTGPIRVKNSDGESRVDHFLVVENIFCVLFSIELIIKAMSYQELSSFWNDPTHAKWNLFDLFLVGLMVIENWLLSWALSDEDAPLGALAALRLLRLLRISRIFIMVPELGIMVKSMTAALRSVSSTLVLAIGLIYVFGIIFTQWGKDKPEFNGKGIDDDTGQAKTNFFGRLGWSCMSLMQILIYDDAAGTFSLIRDVYIANHLMGILLIFFIMIGAFTVLNMLIGVIVEIVSRTKEEEEEKMLIRKVQDMFMEIDEDGSGTISKEEFEPKTKLLATLGLDQDTCRLAFDLIDADGSGVLEMQEFLDMILRLLHPPSSQDIMVMKQNLTLLCERLNVAAFHSTLSPKATLTSGREDEPGANDKKMNRAKSTMTVTGDDLKEKEKKEYRPRGSRAPIERDKSLADDIKAAVMDAVSSSQMLKRPSIFKSPSKENTGQSPTTPNTTIVSPKIPSNPKPLAEITSPGPTPRLSARRLSAGLGGRNPNTIQGPVTRSDVERVELLLKSCEGFLQEIKQRLPRTLPESASQTMSDNDMAPP